MKAIVLRAPNELAHCEVETPLPGPGQVRIRTSAVGICGTDILMIRGAPRVKPGAILGHEWSGSVDAVGEGVPSSLVGVRCVADNVQPDGGEVGFEHPGGYGEQFLTDVRLLQILPADFPAGAAAMIEPLAVCVRAMTRIGPDARGPVLVLGDGPIGLLLVLLCVRAGLGPVTIIGGRPERLALARRFGAETVINRHGEHAMPTGFGVVIEASGSEQAAHDSLSQVAPDGRILVIGDYGTATSRFPWNDLMHHELRLIGSNASAGAWPEAVRLAVAEALPIGLLATHTVAPGRFQDGIDLTCDRSSGAVKVLIDWGT